MSKKTALCERQGFGAKRQVSHLTSRLWSRLPLCPWSTWSRHLCRREAREARRSGGARPAAAVETICFISFISFGMRRGVSRSNLCTAQRLTEPTCKWRLVQKVATHIRGTERKRVRLPCSAVRPSPLLVSSYLISGLIFYCIQLTRSSSRSFCH